MLLQQIEGKLWNIKMKVNILTGVRKGGPYNWGRDLAAELNKHGVEAKHIHALKTSILSPFHQNADIIHTAVPLTFRLWTKPVVISVRGEYPSEKNIWRFFYPMAIRKANIVTTPSHFLKERLNLESAIVIPNAVFPEEFKPVEHSEKNTINLVTITNFYFKDKSKGILDILDILHGAQREVREQIKYSVIGGGPYLKQVMGEAKRHNINVQFTGTLRSPKGILECSDIFIYYSYQDNFPIAILEAMACGLPVITNDIGAVSEIIENEKDGYIAMSNNVYIEYLLSLVKNLNLRVKTGENARKAVETKFNWKNIVNNYIDIYEKII